MRKFWEWCDHQLHRLDLEKRHPILKAVSYIKHRMGALEIFLSHQEVPIDTNHLERALRAIPMGRENWLFCWTELGAKQVAIVQSHCWSPAVSTASIRLPTWSMCSSA